MATKNKQLAAVKESQGIGVFDIIGLIWNFFAKVILSLSIVADMGQTFVIKQQLKQLDGLTVDQQTEIKKRLELSV